MEFAPGAIDVHHHWMSEEQAKGIAKHLRSNEKVEIVPSHYSSDWYPMVAKKETLAVIRDGLTLFNVPPVLTDLRTQVSLMDHAGVGLAVISLGVWQEWNSPALAPPINDAVANAVKEHPTRLIGVAHVPQLGEEGVDELDRAIKDLGLRGIGVVTHIGGHYPDSEAWEPLLKKADKLGLPIVVHPASLPYEQQSLKRRDGGPFVWSRLVGRAYDLTLFTLKVMTGGVLDKYPNTKFVVAHTGGTFFALADTFTSRTKENLRAYNDRLFFDTAARHTQAEVEMARKVIGPESLLYGSDFPYRTLDKSITMLDGLSKDERKMVSRNNALHLFRLGE